MADDSGRGSTLGYDHVFVFVEVAHKDHLDPVFTGARLEMLVRDVPLSTHIMCGIGGYDDDPRGLWDIPEVMEFLCGLAKHLRVTTGERLDSEFRNLVTMAVLGRENFEVEDQPDGTIKFTHKEEER